MANVEELRTDFEVKLREYLDAHKRFSEALTKALQSSSKDAFREYERADQHQHDKHDAYYGAAKKLRDILNPATSHQ